MVLLFVQFILELKKGFKYLLLGFMGFVCFLSAILGLSWGTGWVIDKFLKIEQMVPSNYVVYGFYSVITILFVSVFILAIFVWLMLSYKTVMDRIKNVTK